MEARIHVIKRKQHSNAAFWSQIYLIHEVTDQKTVNNRLRVKHIAHDRSVEAYMLGFNRVSCF